MAEKIRAERNRTITLKEEEKAILKKKLLTQKDIDSACAKPDFYLDRTINSDLLAALPLLPDSFADLIIIDPPYNLIKNFNGKVFSARDESEYENYLETWFPQVCKKLKPHGSLYMCCDWKCTASIQRIMEKELTVLNRITWQREKGRGAKENWKNSMEIG